MKVKVRQVRQIIPVGAVSGAWLAVGSGKVAVGSSSLIDRISYR